MRAVAQLILFSCIATWVPAAESGARRTVESIEFRIVSSSSDDDSFVSEQVACAGESMGLSDYTAFVSDRGAICTYAGRSIPISIDALRKNGEIVVIARCISPAADEIQEKKWHDSYRELIGLLSSVFTKKYGDKLTITNTTEKEEKPNKRTTDNSGAAPLVSDCRRSAKCRS